MLNGISDTIRLLRGTNLKAKSARAVIALGVGTVAGRGLRMVRYMILARLLAPNEFGLMAIVMVAAMAFEAFTEVGLKQSVIQNKRGATSEYLNVTWWIQAIRGLGLFILATLAAPWISSFYDKPQLLRLFQVSFVSILFRGFISPRAYVLEKEYKFGWAVVLSQGSSILATIVTIAAAFMIRGIWALVIGFVAEAAILCFLSYIFVPFLPSLKIDRECLRELMKFARGMFGLPFLAWIGFQTDVLVLGKVATDEQLGMYSLAVILSYLPIDLFSQIISPVLLPGFAQKQDDRNALCRVVLEVTRGTAIFILPLVAFMTSCASGILLLAYGPKYVAVTFPFAILCLIILARVEGVIPSSLYLAVGKPHLQRRFVSVRALIIVSLIYPAAVYFGLLGAAGIVVLANFAALFMQIFWCRRVIELDFSRYMRCYVPGLLLALPVVVIVGLLRLSGINSPIPVLIAGAIAFSAISIGGIFVLNHPNEPSITKKEYMDKLDCLSANSVNDA